MYILNFFGNELMVILGILTLIFLLMTVANRYLRKNIKFHKVFALATVILALSHFLVGVNLFATSNQLETPNKKFTLVQLAQNNGQNGMPAYVAIDGIVYDVSKFSKWANGNHFGGAIAGKDLSSLIRKAPHGVGKLKFLTVVGKLEI